MDASHATTTLATGSIGSVYDVVSFGDLPDATARRLESVGMTPGVPITVLNNKSHGTVVVRLRETRWALGRSISSKIIVRPQEPQAVPFEAKVKMRPDIMPETDGRDAKEASRD